MKRFSTLLLILISLCCLFSCGAEDNAPEGLQTVDYNDENGYILYGPEGWEIANRGGISASYVTAINTTSITFTKADMPDVAPDMPLEVSLDQYFDASMAQLPYEISVLKRENTSFGNATSARKYIYAFKYEDYSFATMQILVCYGEDFYIFTYNSYGDPNDSASDYQSYLETVQLAIDSFKFIEKSDSTTEIIYEKDADGYNLVSDRKLAGYDLYLPDGCTVIDNGAMVSAKLSNNANINLAKASNTGVSVLTYIENRHAELLRVVDNLQPVKIGVPKAVDTSSEFFDDWSLEKYPELDESIVFGDLARESVVSYEYTYEFAGTSYHVYQLLGVDSYSGYVFTYTATENEYAEHLDEVMTILEKVRF